jgi:phosphatidylglycerol lysyltransferase
MMGRFLKILLPFVPLVVGVVVVLLLHHELRHYDYHAIRENLRSVPLRKIAIALALTAVSYALLTVYDFLALKQIGRSPGFWRTAFASFTAYVLSYNIGMSVISGTAVRFRLYSSWGYTSREIARIVTFTGLTFWVGLFSAAGTLLVAGRAEAWPGSPFISSHLRAIGGTLLTIVALYLIACVVRRAPFTVKGWILQLPRWPTAVGQMVLGSVDVAVAGLVGWVLMPPGWPLEHFLSVYLLGMTLGLLSHVPGGLGVLETILLYGRPDLIPGPAVLGSIVVFRVVYYLVPLGFALVLLAGHEARRHRHRLQNASAFAGRWLPRIAPNLFAATTFLAGIILLFSGATPGIHTRLAWLRSLVPLPVLEVSHLLGSVVGVLLLFVARGLQRRLDGAYLLTITLLGAGAIFSLLKGADWEEAFALIVMLALMLPCRDLFHRRASLLEARLSAGWITAIVFALGATTWLGFFAYRHVEYRNELWWTFALRGNAPRFLRAEIAALAVVAAVGLLRLLRPAPKARPTATPADLERAAPIVAASTDSNAQLALVGDKALLFSETGRSFIMHGAAGRSWVALGDPIGPREEREDLVWTFRELCDHHGAWTVFYEISADDLPLYLDLGLALTKLGEEARVPLAEFSLERPEFKGLRQTLRRVESEGATFEWIDTPGVPPLLPELRAISDAWLAKHAMREKRFSLGFFAEDYLRRNPLAIVRQGGRIVAFANIWCGAEHAELSVDLMRYHDDAPPRTMEFLLTQLMLRGAQDGYAWFNLGMAPLSGMENHALAPLQRRLAALVYEHGERFYHFQGLRAFKEKFQPVWTPRYLASPGGLALPVILTNVTALVSGS